MSTEPRAASAATHDLSFVIPAHNEEENLRELVDQIQANVPEEMSYEIILVDDGSTDGTWEVIEELCSSRPEVRGIHLLTRGGKSAAFGAGFPVATGRYVFTMDADLQNDPADVPNFLQAMHQGAYDLLVGWREKRHDHAEKRIISAISNWWMRKVVRVPLHDINCGFKCFRNDVVKALPLYGELYRQIPVFAYHRGYTRIGEIPIVHHPRRRGQSKYGVERYWRATFDMVTALFLVRFSGRPLHFFASIGLPCLILGLGGTILGLLSWRVGVLFILGLTLLVLATITISAGLLAELLVYYCLGSDRPIFRDRKPEGD